MMQGETWEAGHERRENIRPANPFEQKPIEQHESLKARNALAETLEDTSISPRASLELLIDFDDKIAVEKLPSLPEIAQEYGFDLQEIPENRLLKLAMIYSEANRTTNQASKQELEDAFARQLHEQLTESALEKIDILSKQLESNLKDPEAIKTTLRNILDRMGRLSEQLPTEKSENLDLWKKMYDKFVALIAIKRRDEQVSHIFSEIFQEYNDFIDNEFAIQAYYYNKQNGIKMDLEDTMRETYGRTYEEMEAIKSQNRIKSLKEIADLKHNESFTVDDIISLHSTNNQGISPRVFSRLRDRHESFGQRMGTLPDDLVEEMKEWQDRVNIVIQKSSADSWTDMRYQIAVAQLHNQLLDIHPFTDRNGSTSLLFLELMMARRGHEPSEKREKDFYKPVKQALGNNPVAIGLIAYEMGLIKYQSGYFKGKTTKGKEKEYDITMKAIRRKKNQNKNPPE